MKRVLQNYEFQDHLGSGSFSKVYKVTNIQTNQIFACKIFSKKNLSDQSDVERFQREINVMAFIRHSNVIALHDFFWDNSNFYLIIDLCEGGELFEYLMKYNQNLDEASSSLIFRQVCEAVYTCHNSGIVHRDLKPENILVDNFPHVKIIDFGLCGPTSEEIMNQTFCGSPCYCSPECLCRVPYDGRIADVWSLGVILYTLVSRQSPWNTQNTSIMIHQILKGEYQFPSTVSESCQNLIRGMMKVTPIERFTMEQVLSHPWLSLGENSILYPRFQRLEALIQSNLQPRKDIIISKASSLIAERSTSSSNGIYSPFAKAKIPGASSLPKLLIEDNDEDNALIKKSYSTNIDPLISNSNTTRRNGQKIFRKTTAARILMSHKVTYSNNAKLTNIP